MAASSSTSSASVEPCPPGLRAQRNSKRQRVGGEGESKEDDWWYFFSYYDEDDEASEQVEIQCTDRPGIHFIGIHARDIAPEFIEFLDGCKGWIEDGEGKLHDKGVQEGDDLLLWYRVIVNLYHHSEKMKKHSDLWKRLGYRAETGLKMHEELRSKAVYYAYGELMPRCRMFRIQLF